jgi:hypothetical protein
MRIQNNNEGYDNKNKYIVIPDSLGNKNIWECVSDKGEIYIIKTRDSTATIFKNLCFKTKNSTMLQTNCIIDIEDCNIELENEEEFSKYEFENYKKENENINPFRVFSKIRDIGYLEDVSDWFEYFKKESD